MTADRHSDPEPRLSLANTTLKPTGTWMLPVSMAEPPFWMIRPLIIRALRPHHIAKAQ
ncbi:MAG: hypothetical protein LRZ88_08205 [Candidatus Cloacimonetes bacterium]|nr:hypothetical protein [Candidatus Cloacimonadota bacterium]